ncbi:AraC family transcriptional regulator [Pelagibius sp. 7325]|uniref:helix-turn-helix transcriptional regulator n=1 Tax=Pelagibius sp. 7325 TaxID=3131994 RepID=UPI0030EF5105
MLRQPISFCGNEFSANIGRNGRHKAVAALLEDALRDLAVDHAAAKRCIEEAAAILSGQIDSHSPGMATQPSIARGGLAPWQIKQLHAYIAENLPLPIALEDLAAICRLSVSHFSRAFKASFGESPHSYIMLRRIEEAKRLMLVSDEPLSQVALACGFADQSHFCRSFRRAEGASPNLWRRARAFGPVTAMAG